MNSNPSGVIQTATIRHKHVVPTPRFSHNASFQRQSYRFGSYHKVMPTGRACQGFCSESIVWRAGRQGLRTDGGLINPTQVFGARQLIQPKEPFP
jgi:hypothetical protein